MFKVLLVEDSAEIQRRLVGMLAAVPDVQVLGCAETASQALSMARQCRPDLVVLDVALRDGDRGYAVMRRLSRECPQCQVIVLSNFGWGAMREGFLRAGARAYFDKAFEFDKARDWIFREAGHHPHQGQALR